VTMCTTFSTPQSTSVPVFAPCWVAVSTYQPPDMYGHVPWRPLFAFKITPSRVGICQIWTPSNAWFNWTHQNPHPKRHVDQFSRSCRAHGRDGQTDRPRHSVSGNRPHLASAAMRPNKQKGVTHRRRIVQASISTATWAYFSRSTPTLDACCDDRRHATRRLFTMSTTISRTSCMYCVISLCCRPPSAPVITQSSSVRLPLYTLWVKKGCHSNHSYNFVNSWSICKILSLL